MSAKRYVESIVWVPLDLELPNAGDHVLLRLLDGVGCGHLSERGRFKSEFTKRIFRKEEVTGWAHWPTGEPDQPELFEEV
jgi:hypothetical protein